MWSWYRSFPEQLIVAHLLKELCVIVKADDSSLSQKTLTLGSIFNEVDLSKK